MSLSPGVYRISQLQMDVENPPEPGAAPPPARSFARAVTRVARDAVNDTRRLGAFMLPANCPLYTMQVLVSVCGMGLCGSMLAVGRDPAVYLPVVSAIVAYWLPAPSRPPKVGTPAQYAGAADAARDYARYANGAAVDAIAAARGLQADISQGIAPHQSVTSVGSHDFTAGGVGVHDGASRRSTSEERRRRRGGYKRRFLENQRVRRAANDRHVHFHLPHRRAPLERTCSTDLSTELSQLSTELSARLSAVVDQLPRASPLRAPASPLASPLRAG